MNWELLLQVTLPLFTSMACLALFIWGYFSLRFSKIYERLYKLESSFDAVYDRLSKLERAALEKNYSML